jgi:23S rRNA A2030 N6-methylase RlmJ
MLILNPPWQLDIALRAACTELLPVLAPEGQGEVRVDWLARE